MTCEEYQLSNKSHPLERTTAERVARFAHNQTCAECGAADEKQAADNRRYFIKTLGEEGYARFMAKLSVIAKMVCDHDCADPEALSILEKLP